jgi:hypothetical protein
MENRQQMAAGSHFFLFISELMASAPFYNRKEPNAICIEIPEI